MRRHCILLFAAVSVHFAAAYNAYGQQPIADWDVQQLASRWATAIEQRQKGALMRQMAPDFAYTHHDGQRYTRTTFADSVLANKSLLSLVMDATGHKQQESELVITVAYRMSREQGDTAQEFYAEGELVLRLYKGKWLVVRYKTGQPKAE